MRYLPQQQCYVQNRILKHGVRHHFWRGVTFLCSWMLRWGSRGCSNDSENDMGKQNQILGSNRISYCNIKNPLLRVK